MAHGLYSLWAPFYDWFAGPLFDEFRRRAIAELDLEPGHRLFISGVGTGLDFPHLPPGIEVVGVDITPAMLDRARRRAQALGLKARLEIADAGAVPYPDSSFDRAYLPLIVCVAQDGSEVLREAVRLVKPGGRLVLIDKFLGEGETPGLVRSAVEFVSGPVITHVNRRWSEIAAGVRGFTVLSETPGPLRGFFRMFVLRKEA